MKHKAFTLIELLVVIVIIGILAAISTATFQGHIEKGRRAVAQAELRQIGDSIKAFRVKEEVSLYDITGRTCSNCDFCRHMDLRGVADTHQCAVAWDSLLSQVESSIGVGLEEFRRDPWGSPYHFDENEGVPSNPCSSGDLLVSSGPDGRSGSSSLNPELNDDDERLRLPLLLCD